MAMAKSTIIPFTLTASVDLTDVRSEFRALAEGLLRSLGDSYYAERERGDIATIDAATEPAQVAAPAKPIRFDDYVITPISPMKDGDSGPMIVGASWLRDGCTFIGVGRYHPSRPSGRCYHWIHLDESDTIAVRDLLNGIIAAGEEIKRKIDA